MFHVSAVDTVSGRTAHNLTVILIDLSNPLSFFLFLFEFGVFFTKPCSFNWIFGLTKLEIEANAPVDISTTLHWFAQIGHDLVETDERDNGEGKTRVELFENQIKASN